MEAFLQKKEMVRSRQDNYTETAHLKFVFTQCGGATLSQSDTLKFFGRDPRVASLLKAFSLQTAMHFSAVMRPG